MKRKLLKQMRTEWQENLWLIIELSVVFLAIWGMSVVLWSISRGIFEPFGSDPDDVYSLTTQYFKKDSPFYVEGDSTKEFYQNDLRQLVNALRKNPNVAAVAVHNNALPYELSNYGNRLWLVKEEDSVGYGGNFRYATPDIIDVLGVKSLTGSNSGQLKEILRKGELLISNNPEYEKDGNNPNSLIGKQVIMGSDSSTVYRIGDVVQLIRRTEYEAANLGGVIVPMPEDETLWGNVILKLKPGTESRFREEFRDNPDLRRYRNVYLSDLVSLKDMRMLVQKKDEVTIRTYMSMMLCLLITVFLGLVGTFWFRIQQRISEIAIRKVCGASRKNIFRRIIGEGMILLLCSTVIALVCAYPFLSDFEDIVAESFMIYMDSFDDLTEKLILGGATFIIIALGIIISLWCPAHRAMKIEPAIAVKDE